MNIDIKAIGIGLLIFIATGIMGLMGLALFSESASIGLASAVLPYVGTAIAGGVTSHRARHGKIASAILLSFVIAIGFGILNLSWSALGMPADLAGLKGSVWVAVLSLPESLLLCAGSALIVAWLNRAAPNNQLKPDARKTRAS
jgi:hypothetical protein